MKFDIKILLASIAMRNLFAPIRNCTRIPNTGNEKKLRRGTACISSDGLGGGGEPLTPNKILCWHPSLAEGFALPNSGSIPRFPLHWRIKDFPEAPTPEGHQPTI